VPIPWSGSSAPYGFGPEGSTPWLPQPDSWKELSVEAQAGQDGSTLELFRSILRLRKRLVGSGPAVWLEELPADVLGFRRGELTVVMNLGDSPVPAPSVAGEHRLVLASDPACTSAMLPPNSSAWFATPGWASA
jgi:alpha-glucosidase